MAPEHVREIEDRWPTVGAGVENGKHCLEVAIQVYRWNYVAAKLQQIVARVPPAMSERLRARLQCPQLARRSFPLRLERREFPLSQCPPPVHESARAKAGRPLWEAACHRGIGRFVPPRHACGASARFLRYGGSPTSESYPRFILTCGLCSPKTSSYESYHWARQLAANRSQKRSGSYYPGLLAIRKLASQKS